MSIPTTILRSRSSLGRRQLPLCCPAGDAGGLHHQAGHQCHDDGDLHPDHVVGQAEQEASCLGSDGQWGTESSLPALNLYPVASLHHHQSSCPIVAPIRVSFNLIWMFLLSVVPGFLLSLSFSNLIICSYFLWFAELDLPLFRFLHVNHVGFSWFLIHISFTFYNKTILLHFKFLLWIKCSFFSLTFTF